MDLTVVLRRRAELPRGLVEGPDTVSADDLAARFGADPDDVARARAVFESAGLAVTDVHLGSRRMSVSGTAAAVSALFGTELSIVSSTGQRGQRVEHRSRSGELHIPSELDGAVVAVLGMDTRPQGALSPRAVSQPERIGYDPPFLAEVYGFPTDTDGSGQIAAIIELGGGYEQSDLDAYFASLKLPTPKITAVSVDGAVNSPGHDADVDVEVELDIEVLGAVAPGAEIVVYFTPNTAKAWLDAVSAAVHATRTPTAVSISWGTPEDQWTDQSLTAMEEVFADAAALGVTVCGPAGDNGSADNETDGATHLDYPGSSPHVLAVGGTTLRVAPQHVETVWNGTDGGATGGGVSAKFPTPAWQTAVGVPDRVGTTKSGRGVPDVAAVADPATGYAVLISGKSTVVGGTSAAVPLWTALVCRLNQALGRRLGLLQPSLYAGAVPGTPTPGLRDIDTGDNGAYKAAPGWDPCTGLGVPDGPALLTRLAASTARQPS